MKVGFTGTRAGMTPEQQKSLRVVFATISELDESEVTEFHHGDCVGADVEAVTYARRHGWYIAAHPSDIEGTTAHAPSDVTFAPRPPLERNHVIVDETEILICCPRQATEILRSGTWATKRYAWKTMKKTLTIYPDGGVS